MELKNIVEIQKKITEIMAICNELYKTLDDMKLSGAKPKKDNNNKEPPKDEPPKEETKKRGRKSKKTITIVDDSGEDPLTVEV